MQSTTTAAASAASAASADVASALAALRSAAALLVEQARAKQQQQQSQSSPPSSSTSRQLATAGALALLRLKAALRAGGNTRLMTKVYSDADHTFTIVGPGKTGGWPKHEPHYAGLMLNWIGAQVGY